MQKEKVMENYTPELLFRYIQLQINELSEKVTNIEAFKV